MEIDNASRLEENFRTLSAEMANLNLIRNHEQQKSKTSKGRWLEKVDATEEVVDAIRRDIQEQIAGSNHLYNLRARQRLNKRVVESLKTVKALKQEGKAPAESLVTFLNAFVLEQPKQYSHQDLRSFTSSFSKSKIIHSDGFGDVYEGQIPGSKQVAVKVLVDDVAEDTFKSEVSTLGKASHNNVVKLYGFCCDKNINALIYEYVGKISLDMVLYEDELDIEWHKLYATAIGIAKGLTYLHNDCTNRIIHRDVRAANVLLDEDFSPKVAEFGLAKIVQRDSSHITLTRTRGTPGYAAPEMWMPAAQITPKCDVYSFGMMLFEILGRRCNSEYKKRWFPKQVWDMFASGEMNKIIEECEIMEEDRENAEILTKVALLCAQYEPKKRPSMINVVKMLEKDMPITEPSNPFSHYG